jgi:hypothetical protein
MFIKDSVSESVIGLRYASRASVVRIFRAQGNSSVAPDGLQMKTLSRLGVLTGRVPS